mmetsp:Transcript_8124/g.11166  ORF Transcript_8124/g.11166 Transcript_8124/m.11166 type:complete len:311 (-) Transcript_8124:131-1063(-)|eukprot:CAMPEP_0185725368 /NCGR_PEP_ID=MMETSP1171-20130828/1647_1 /TAXON_ID=374046 /ORGANISM="Helicotheca tamensis, Strain CCMP826" /LENGTH=310 /DNA_ID=CAMNT_0028393481 /DNA_START=107 /DNA_END=1039 /DNA_ORIENTATION=+
MKIWSFLLFTITYLLLVSLANSEDASNTCNEGSGSCRSYSILGKPKEFADGVIPGVKLAVRRWIPPSSTDTKAVILFHHGGAGWHSGYGDIMGTFMQNAGIAVISYDTMGAGHSTGMDGLCQYFPNMTVLTDDFSQMLTKVRKEYPSKKIFAMGESFGGMVLASQILFEQRKQDEGVLADGYLFTGPVIKLLRTDVFSTFDLAFGDKGWAKAGRNDPIIQEAAQIPPRLGMAASILSNMDQMYRDLDEVKVPFKIWMGEHEQRVDTDAIRYFAKVASSKDKELEVVNGAYHQLFQDLPDVTNKVCENVRD